MASGSHPEGRAFRRGPADTEIRHTASAEATLLNDRGREVGPVRLGSEGGAGSRLEGRPRLPEALRAHPHVEDGVEVAVALSQAAQEVLKKRVGVRLTPQRRGMEGGKGLHVPGMVVE